MRKELKEQEETIPNQIGKATGTPTLRWVFQIFEGINYVKIVTDNKIECIVDGLTSLHKKILRFFGKTVCEIYQISPI
jgi:hypothetical protein